MPKARTTESDWVGWLVGSMLLGLVTGAAAQAPSLMDVVETSKQTKMKEQSKALSDAFRPTPPVDVGPSRPTGKPVDVMPLPEPAAPVLRAIYGVNQTLEAEVVYDGQSHSVYSDDERTEIGPWRHARVMPDSVVLSRAPLTSFQREQIDEWRDSGMERRITCARLGLKAASCLVLRANKASSGSAPTAGIASGRMPSMAPSPLPQLPPLPPAR